MTTQRALYYTKSWGRSLLSLKAVSAVLSSFGALWLGVEIASYFFKGTTLPSIIQGHWGLFALMGGAIALWICRPALSTSAKLNGRDVIIEIAVGNLFSFSDALVVGTNTTFDTRISRELISEKSIQGQFTKKYYGDEVQLDAELNTGLNGVSYEELKEQRVGKTRRYPIGTVVRLNPKNCTAYFVATAQLNEHGVASGSFEDLRQSLGQLWVFVGRRGLKEPLVMPVLGSGFARLTQPREEIVREIIKSFIAACSEKTFCDKLTIVLSERDVLNHQIDVGVLGAYLRHVCTYTEFATNGGVRMGTPAS